MPESNRDEIAKLEALYATNPAGRVFTHLAEAYRKAGEYDRARAILEQGLEKHPTYASAHVVLGRVLMDLNKSDEAVESFRKVLQLDPHNLVALRSLGDLARAGGRNAEAMGYFEELRHQDPSNEEISGIIAELLAAPDFHAAEPPEPLPELLEPEIARAPEAEQPAAEAPPETQLEEMMAQAVEPEWSPSETEPETLPGDLADFARQASTADDYGTVNLEGAVAEPAAAEAAMEEPAAEQSHPAVEEVEAPQAAVFEPSFEESPVAEPEAASETVAEEAPVVEPPAEPPISEEPIAELPPAEMVDLGPSDLEVAVPPEETFESIDLSEFSAAAEEPAFVEQETTETTLEPIEPEPEVPAEPLAAFVPEPELAEQAPVLFEPAAEVFEPPPESFEPAPIEAFEPPPAFELEPPGPNAEVLTETIAELYRSQGLNDRAAEVYRALLQDRPGDTHLLAKLRDAEGAMMQPPVEEAPVFEVPAQAEEQQPFAAEVPAVTTGDEEVKSPWTGINQAAASSPSLYAWEEDTPTEDAGPPVSEYFRALLSWRPGNQVQSIFTEPVSAATEEQELFDLGAPIETAAEPLFEEPVTPVDVSAESPAAGTQMPWDEPTPAGIAGEETARDDFEDWFAEEPPAEATQEPPPNTAATPPTMAAEPAEGDEEDDDLEMFRSWLQSLKK